MVFAIVFLIAEYSRIGDFEIFLRASVALGNNEDIYKISYIHGFKYFYSPLFAVFIYPLTLIPSSLAGLIWNSLSFFLLARIFWLISEMFLKNFQIDIKKIQTLTFIAVLLPVYANFHATQMSVFVLYSIIECLYQIRKNKYPVFGAAILALAINIKILPIVIIPYLLYRKEFKAIILTLIFTLIYLIIPGLLLGMKTNLELHLSWLRLIDPTTTINIIDLNERGLHSVTSLVSSLFTDYTNPYELTIKRNILNLNESTVSLIITIIRSFLILFTLYFLRTLPFRKQKNPLFVFWEVSYICLVIPLIFPHQQIYAFLLILPAAYYLVFYFMNAKPSYINKWKFHLVKGLGIGAFLIINLQLILGMYREIFWHFKTITYGVILLMIVLAFCVPSKLISEKKHAVS